MVRQMVRAQSLLLKKKLHNKQKVRIQFVLFKTNKQTNKHGKAKGKNSILTFQTNHMARKIGRTRFLFFEKKITW